MVDLIDRAALSKLFEERFLYLKGASEQPLSGGYVLIDTEIQTGAIIAKEFLDHVRKAPAVDAVEAIKSTEEIEQALSILNIYRNGYYAEPSGTVKYAVANAINIILPLFAKCLERRTDATN